VSVYLPDDLYQAARDRKLSISALTQRAIEQELQAGAVNDWIQRMRARSPSKVGDFDMSELMDEVRDEFGT
jgi:post-segregation antitoxin (ccd killing protein)